MTDQDDRSSDKITRIRAAYLQQLPAQIAAIQAAHERCEAGAAPAEQENLFRLIHNLKGGSASFGLRPLSEAALGGERLAKEALDAGAGVDPVWHGRMRECIQRMSQACGPGAPCPEPAPAPVPAARGGERRRVFVCDDDPFLVQALVEQIRYFGFDVSPFEALQPFRDAVEKDPPDAIVMDVMFPGRPMGGPETMNLIQADRPVAIPTVYISSQSGLSSRLAAARAGSSAYMVKPVNITDLCGRLARLTAPETSEPYRVLIVDDDPPLAEYHAQILREAGMETRIVTDPLLAMDPLMEMRPDLILMDMYMPGCTGVELAKTIRQIDTFFSIPIVFLSSETDQDRQVHALVTGGDEFLAKPIKPGNLVTAVAVRAERMKILRSFMIRDSMTGLFNHTATKDFLDSAIADAGRTGKEVCFAMIDLDRFKLVNDTYGHALGDRVLIALSRLLQQRLRKSDLVGRFGGEEFAVVLPDCSLPRARSIVDEIRASFAEVIFRAEGATFTSTFSAGVAALSMQPDVATLCKAADEALYQAKSAGRNRVVANGPCPPATMPGLDLAKALSGLKGNWVRLHRLLKDFAEDSRDAIPELASRLAAGDLAGAGAQLHTLKGVAGMLGANRLREAARTVETELNAGQIPPPSWLPLENAMRELLDGIQALNQP